MLRDHSTEVCLMTNESGFMTSCKRLSEIKFSASFVTKITRDQKAIIHRWIRRMRASRVSAIAVNATFLYYCHCVVVGFFRGEGGWSCDSYRYHLKNLLDFNKLIHQIANQNVGEKNPPQTYES